MALRDDVRAAISTAYYDARNDGRTMESAANQATASVMNLIDSAFGQSESTQPRGERSAD